VVCVVGLFIYSIPRSDSSDSTATEREQRNGESGKLPPDEIASSLSVVELAQHNRTQTAVEKLALKQDASNDDWDTEVLSDAASEQLTNMQMLLENPDRIESPAIESLVTSEFTCQSLRPHALAEVFQEGPITVRRPIKSTPTSNAQTFGTAEFVEALRQLTTALGNGDERRIKFKLFRIDKQQDHFVTHVRYEASNHNAAGSQQQTTTWRCHWTFPKSDGRQTPRLIRIAVEDYEEAQIAIPGGRLFVDCTQSTLAGNVVYEQQVLPGINHWLTRIPKEFMGRFGHHGIALGDVNGDDLEDLYVCDAGGLPNRLYIQQSDGTVVDVSSQSGVDLLEDSVGALLIDLDNDGDQDLVVGTDPLLQLAENDGHGRFTWRNGIDVNTDSFSLSAADYDVDGDLDIYVCGYKVGKQDPTHRGLPFPLPYHDANNGGKNLLLRNDGDFQFTDVTALTGLDVNNTRFTMAAGWEDFDNDGDLDLYVANDFGRNNLYRNDGGFFTDIAAVAGVEDHASGMSVAWGDYNRDGRMDLYVGNMFSAAGNRITYQRRFSTGLPDQTVSHLQRMARGNTLFENVTDASASQFRDVSQQVAVNMGRWSWASKFVDLTNDGWPDLIVANGYVTGDDKSDL
jgi:hypothetical protein